MSPAPAPGSLARVLTCQDFLITCRHLASLTAWVSHPLVPIGRVKRHSATVLMRPYRMAAPPCSSADFRPLCGETLSMIAPHPQVYFGRRATFDRGPSASR